MPTDKSINSSRNREEPITGTYGVLALKITTKSLKSKNLVGSDVNTTDGTVAGVRATEELIVQDELDSENIHGYKLQDEDLPTGEHYNLDITKPGKVLIINNNFKLSRMVKSDYEKKGKKILSERNGTEVDVESITQLFESMGCDVYTEDNVTIDKWEEKVEMFKSECKNTASSFIAVFVLTHGAEGNMIYTQDGELINLYEKVVFPFNNLNLSEYREKPKLFFIQACNGSGAEVGKTIDGKNDSGEKTENSKLTTKEQGDESEAKKQKIYGHLEDVFVGRASIPLTVAKRKEDGSPYIQNINKVFSENWKKFDLVKMHEKVEDMTKKSAYQTPYQERHMFRKLFVFPNFKQ